MSQVGPPKDGEVKLKTFPTYSCRVQLKMLIYTNETVIIFKWSPHACFSTILSSFSALLLFLSVCLFPTIDRFYMLGKIYSITSFWLSFVNLFLGKFLSHQMLRLYSVLNCFCSAQKITSMGTLHSHVLLGISNYYSPIFIRGRQRMVWFSNQVSIVSFFPNSQTDEFLSWKIQKFGFMACPFFV